MVFYPLWGVQSQARHISKVYFAQHETFKLIGESNICYQASFSPAGLYILSICVKFMLICGAFLIS